MTRRVVYANGNTYQSAGESAFWRKNTSLEVVEWLNSLAGADIDGKRVKEVVNFQIHHRSTWECFALVEVEE